MGSTVEEYITVEKPIYILDKNTGETVDVSSVITPIHGNPEGKNFLYMEQLTSDDIYQYIEEAYAAEALLKDPARRGINLLPRAVLKAVMRQPSTRTGGSLTTAIDKLGGRGELISGMHSSSEAKGEKLADSWIAFATQADLIATRTAEEYGPAYAALVIEEAFKNGKLSKRVPVVSGGDGKWQHPTQAEGDIYTIHKRFNRQVEGLVMAIVGDHERYRAFHSLILGSVAVGMKIITVESAAAPVPQSIINAAGSNLIIRTNDLDSAMSEANVLYLGRNPDEYVGEDSVEIERSEKLSKDFRSWRVDFSRIQKMKTDAIVLHPRPRKDELDPNVDEDPRMADVEQMENMIPIRMAIIARHLGKSIIEAAKNEQAA